MSKYKKSKSICIDLNGMKIDCDDYVILCKKTNSDKMEVFSNVQPPGIAVMLIPIMDFVNDSLGLYELEN